MSLKNSILSHIVKKLQNFLTEKYIIYYILDFKLKKFHQKLYLFTLIN